MVEAIKSLGSRLLIIHDGCFCTREKEKNREEIIEVENYRKLRRICRNKSCDCFAAVKTTDDLSAGNYGPINNIR